MNGGEHQKKGILCWYINVVRILSEILNHSGQLMFKLTIDIHKEIPTKKKSFVPFAINCHHIVININPQVNINFPIVGETNSMQPRRETAWLTTPRSLKQWRRGIGVAFPTFSKSSLRPRPRPRPNRVALSFNFVRFTRSPIAILGSIIAFSRLIPRQQCSATVFKRIKRSSLATTKIKKSNRDELRVSLPE